MSPPGGARARSVVLLLVVALSVAACGLLDEEDTEPGSGTVVRAVDGDTMVIDVGGNEERVRLIGVDTPESVRENHPVECFGPEAAERLAELAPQGTAVRLERDVEPRDQYGRLLAYVYRAEDSLHLNLDQIVQGYAEASEYPPNTTLSSDFADAERSARADGLGLWGECGGPDVPAAPPPNR